FRFGNARQSEQARQSEPSRVTQATNTDGGVFTSRQSLVVESRKGAVAGHSRSVSPPTGSSEAVPRPRLPQNVACGVTALRSSAVDSQHRERLQLPVRR